jgi:hypothetical protein
MKKILTLALITALPLLARDNLVSLNLNNTDVEIAYENTRPLQGDSRSFLGLELLNGDDEYDESQLMLSGYIHAMGLTPVPGLGAIIGFKASATRVEIGNEDESLLAIPVQVGVNYTLPIVLRSHIQASVGFAPKALTFGEAETYREYRIRAVIEPMDGGLIYAGWRSLVFDFESGGDYKFNESAFIGIGMVF